MHCYLEKFLRREKKGFTERELSETQIRSRFRFRRETIIFISNLLRNDLERPTKRSQSISVEMQVIFTFHFQKKKNTFKVCFVPSISQILMKMIASELR